MPHRARERFASRFPSHVTLRVLPHVWNLRSRRAFSRLCAALGASRKETFRVVHFSVQGNHLHLIVEATDAQRLARGMQGLAVRIARKLNAMMGVQGTVFAARYHARILRTARQVRNTLLYVLNNARRHAAPHGRAHPSGWLDPFSSAAHFDGWWPPVHGSARAGPVSLAITPARTALLTRAWRALGLLDVDSIPGRQWVEQDGPS